MPDLFRSFGNDQLLFFGGALLLILVLLVHAFKVGFLNQLWNLIVFPASFIIGRYLFKNSPELLQTVLGTNPGIISQGIVAVVGGFISLFILKKFGFILFANTAKKVPFLAKCESPGIFSALVALIPAFFLFLVLAFVARYQGLVDETRFIDERMGRRPGETLIAKPGAMRLREFLDRGALGIFMREFDWYSSEGHKNLMYLLIADAHYNTDISFYLRNNPQIDRLWMSSGLVALRQDPEIRKLIKDRNYSALVGNEKVAKVVWDPEYRDTLRSIDMPKVLERALE